MKGHHRMAGMVFGIRGTDGVSEQFARSLTALIETKGGTVRTISTTGLLGDLAEKLERSPDAVASALGERRIQVLLEDELQRSKATVTIFPEMNGPVSDILVRNASIAGDGVIVEITTDSPDPGGRKLFGHEKRVVFNGSPDDLARRTREFFDANVSFKMSGSTQ